MASRDTLIVARKDDPRHQQVFSIQGQWFPDAFGGSMGELMQALDAGREPGDEWVRQPALDPDCLRGRRKCRDR